MAEFYSNVFVGAQTGLLKGVNTERKVFRNLNSVQSLDKQDEIRAMCWSNNDESEILIGLKNQTIKQFTVDNCQFINSLDASGGEGPIIDLTKIDQKILTCVESGVVRLWNESMNVEVSENTEVMRHNVNDTNFVATGGKENPLKIWDLNKLETPIFKAKNVPHDFLNLRVPIWVKDTHFLPGSKQIVTCTGHHQVRLYDPNTRQRRPMIQVEFGEYPLTAMSLCTIPQNVIVDLRKKRVVHHYKGFAGGIRCIQCHPTLPIVASCGLDRFLRIHDVNTHKLLHKVYLKSALNCLLLRDKQMLDEMEHSEGDKEGESGGSDAELWDSMKLLVIKDGRLWNLRQRKNKK
uniref:WD repeat-containing protein 74 n=1 Tax=Strigamia maritima TaxID=126957 RepID=T1J0T6_STRMM